MQDTISNIVTNALDLVSLAECLYARYLCSRDALGLKAAGRPSAAIGYLVYKPSARLSKAILYTNMNGNLKARLQVEQSKVSCIQRLYTHPVIEYEDGFCSLITYE